LIFSLFLSATLLSYCGSAQLATPDGFVKTNEPGYGYLLRYISSNNSRLTLRKENTNGDGTLDFWYPYIEKTFINDYGYTKVEEPTQIKSANDDEGKMGVFKRDYNGTMYDYLLAVFVHKRKGGKDNDLYIVEY